MSKASYPLLILVGPTASGKTEVALRIASVLPVEMISCDSMQVYCGMPIVTQAPPRSFTKKLSFHLVSFLDPSKEYSAARFREDALKAIHKIVQKGKIPMIVGGTGLYIRALLDGLFESEPGEKARDTAYRMSLLAQQKKYGGSFLHKKLQKVDPKSASRIHANDLRRIVRALEVHRLSGKPISELMPNREGIRHKMPHRIFFLERDRQDLYERINRRVDLMFKYGLIREVKRLTKKRMSKTAGVALGMREVKAYLKGEIELDSAKELLKRNTRHYAKRQISWFRREKGVEWVPVGKEESAKTVAERIVRAYRKEGAA